MITNADISSGWDDVWEGVEGPATPPPRRPRRRRSIGARVMRVLVALGVLAAGLHTLGAGWGLLRTLHALDRADTTEMQADLDFGMVQARLGSELGGLAHMAAAHAPAPAMRNAADAYLGNLARGTAAAWREPLQVARLVHMRLFDPGLERSYGVSRLTDRVSQIRPDGLGAFRVDLTADYGQSVTGISLCFALFPPPGLWRMVGAAWPEFGDRC